jgi:threonine dehydrogenase-like Zn-dependent dehydrogenase
MVSGELLNAAPRLAIRQLSEKNGAEMAKQRRRVLASAPNVIEITTEPVPECKPDQALVSLRVAGICGSDVHGLKGTHPTITLPYYPGHEVVGVVEEIGSNVRDVRVGDVVTPEPTLPCGSCKMCRGDKSNICEALEFFGCGYAEGGMTDVFSIRADRLRLVPQGFDLKQAALIEPLSTPVHAVSLAGDMHDKKVVILGCGTIGLLTLAAVRHAGARYVVMSDVLGSKRERAMRLGADAVVDALSPEFVPAVRDLLGETADVVFDCVANRSTVLTAIALVERGGTVVVVGVPSGSIEIPLERIQDCQIRIQGAATYTTEDYEVAMKIIGLGAVDANQMISSTYLLEDAGRAFKAAAGGEEVKILLLADGLQV